MVPPGSSDAKAPPARPTVLCIDDDPLVLHFYRGFLEPRGYRVLTALEGLKALPWPSRTPPTWSFWTSCCAA